MENQRKDENIQIIFDPDQENVEYKYEIPNTKYLANALMDKGKFGPISSFHKINSDQLVAIKKISNAYESPSKGKKVLQQLSILTFVDHPNVIKLFDIYIPDKEEYNDIYLIEDYMGSNLERCIISDFTLGSSATYFSGIQKIF